MNWEGELLALYEKNEDRVGEMEYKVYKRKGKDGKDEIEEKVWYVLLPPFHTTVKAQIEVTLTSSGKFLRASKVEKERNLTVIPVTEKSGSRTGKCPHPFCDNLKYLAGDYARYVEDKKGDIRSYYELYIEQLEQWQLSDYTHDKVEALYRYLKEETLTEDLVREKVLVLDENGRLSKDIKIGGVLQQDAFVRFIIRNKKGLPTAEESDECWNDRSLRKRFITYYRTIEGEEDLDYLTGEKQIPSYLHSKKIRNEGDSAKLISSNDDLNYTFRGRFATKEQALSIGRESSQKIHNALKWIIRRQGKSFDTLMEVTWESEMKKMPSWEADTETIISAAKETYEEQDGMTMQTAEDENQGQEKVQTFDGNPITASEFYSALDGYGAKVENTSRMILMAFDAASTGRMCLIEYKAMETARYLENIKKWHEYGGWLQFKYKNGMRKSYYGVPGVREIADILYGIESQGRLSIVDKNGKRLYAEVSRRLLPCIWDGRKIPYDFIAAAVNKASMPQSYKERYNWERVLALACSFVKKNRYERNQEVWNVALNEECKERDYLYGRLLAVADRIEYRTYDRENDAGRVTNAKRYMSTFSQRPFETWKIIEENLQPYLGKLSVQERRYYENLIDGICQLFTVERFQDNRRLDGLYLLGFHSQSYELKKYKKEPVKGETE